MTPSCQNNSLSLVCVSKDLLPSKGLMDMFKLHELDIVGGYI